jgi:hypothetical protein
MRWQGNTKCQSSARKVFGWGHPLIAYRVTHKRRQRPRRVKRRAVIIGRASETHSSISFALREVMCGDCTIELLAQRYFDEVIRILILDHSNHAFPQTRKHSALPFEVRFVAWCWKRHSKGHHAHGGPQTVRYELAEGDCCG